MARREIWPDVERVFNEAAELAPAERQSFLEKSCAGNEELRREVESLLEQAEKKGLLGNPALDAAAPMVSEIGRKSWRLSQGTRLGVYEIISSIGAGGMGEVYKARDTKLHRDVAIKVLPENLAEDRERIARFHREAQLLASLNHPRIAAIYGLEEQNGICGLALEFVDGESLAERIARGPLPLDEALSFAGQIAEALGAAHAKGVVHRDLKPDNIKIAKDGTVKVLDFGLAKIFEPQASLANTPTAVNVSTDQNIILGTAAYMSPEQARGKEVDKRTDIWAWGCVLYEMLTGRRAFAGDTTVELLNSVLNAAPNWDELPDTTPTFVRSLLRRCLQKDPNRRLQDIGDARIEIDEGLNQPPIATSLTAPRRNRERLAWGIAMLIAVMASAGLIALYDRTTRPSLVEPETRLQVLTAGGETSPVDRTGIAISADGRKVVFLATTGGKRQLWLRPLQSEQAKLLENTDGAGPPFWSPDSQSVGFATRNDATGRFSLKKIDIAGGTPRTLADITGFFGGSWSNNGTILFSAGGSGSPLFRIPQSGGEPVQVTRLEPNQSGQRYPVFLPDGRHFLFLATGTPDVQGIYLGSLDSQLSRRLFAADSKPEFAPPNYVLFVREQTLLAQRLDMDKLEPVQELFVVAEKVFVNPGVFGMAAFSASVSGALAYGAAPLQSYQWTWVDRSGKPISTVGEPDSASPGGGTLSPNGRTLAFVRETNGNRDIWLMDMMRGSLTRFTTDPATDGSPVWSPEGNRIAFDSSRKKGGGNYGLFQKDLNGGNETPVSEAHESLNALDWSPDSRFLLYTLQKLQTVDSDIWAMPMHGDRTPIPIAQTTFAENGAKFSPDSRWIAYESNDSGRTEIYVQPFPAGTRTKVSSNGGQNLIWNRNGRELNYVGPGSRFMTVAVTLKPNGAADAGTPIPLFTLKPGTHIADFFVDGQRFLLDVPVDTAGPSPITVILNWAGARKENAIRGNP